MKKYETFLFDADGTLFDYDMAEENALKTMFVKFDITYTNAIRQKYREINAEIWKKYEKGENTQDELQTLRFAQLFGEINVDCNAEKFNQQYLAELAKGIFLIDGALEICKKIAASNKKIYIVTNGNLSTQKPRVENSAISELISDFFISEGVGFRKPQAAYFDYVFSHISQTDKSKIIIVGDSLSADIAGGNVAGIDSCWYNPDGAANNTDIVPTYEIAKLSELGEFI
ncbi:MAG: YjjG family noncanonical pyrimidine nucleotidase [Defluviitaleaceae bacterium]|nr:YjjG family noncanonical pyrimidine nucleotidase [Defluviitaleaceae bacterium]